MKFSKVNNWYNEETGKWLPARKIHPQQVETFGDLVETLMEQSVIEYESKEKAPLISPAWYHNGDRRLNENVQGISFLMLDFDDGITIDTVEEWVSELNYIIYSTASCKEDHHKFRLIIETDREIQSCEFAEVWEGANTLFNETIDRQCKDKSRTYYVPGVYPGAMFYYSYNLDGVALNVDGVKGLYTPPAPVAPKKRKPLNNHTVWLSLQHSRYVKVEWINDYRTTPHGQGLHYKKMYEFMVGVAKLALSDGYPVTAHEVAGLARELDQLDGGHYAKKKRPFETEAQRAVNYAYSIM